MAPPQVIGNENPSLESQCLAFIQTLVNQQIGFNFHLTSGSFSCSFDNNGKRKITSARTPSQVKHKSPSTQKRNARRRQQFLENKKFRASSVEQPDQVEPTQSHSESICAPSSDPTDVEKNGLCDVYRKEKGEVQKVPPLKVLVNNQASPKYRLHQVDGECSLSDEDGELSLCDDNQRSEHDDDPKIGQSTSCPNCDQPLLSIFHQCHDPDQQTNIDNHPKNGHSEEIDYDRLFEFEKTYLVDHPDFPENYKKKKEEYFATHASNNSRARTECAIFGLFIDFCYG